MPDDRFNAFHDLTTALIEVTDNIFKEIYALNMQSMHLPKDEYDAKLAALHERLNHEIAASTKRADTRWQRLQASRGFDPGSAKN